MIQEEDRGLLEANKKHELVLQCFYAGRLALLVDLVGGTSTRRTPQQVLELIKKGGRV
jgi:hypothetical protein